MMKITFIGGDVAKSQILFAQHGKDRVEQVANSKTDLRRFFKRLPTGSALAMEATNTYHELAAQLAYDLGIDVYVLNPRDVSHYANSIGMLAKTDPCDARMIARYLAREHTDLHRWKPATQAQEALKALINRRSTLVSSRVAMQQSMGTESELKPVLNGLKKAFAKAVAAIDKAILRRLKEEPELARHADMLKDIPGIGPVVSAALATLLSRHPFASADAAVAFVGLDPRPRESGTWRGQRKLSKRGPTEIRRLLYVAAMTTARNVAMRGEIDRHKAKGLSATAIYNIIARKLLRTAWSMLKHQTPFAMNRFSAA